MVVVGTRINNAFGEFPSRRIVDEAQARR